MDESIVLIDGIPIRKFNFNTKSSLATEWRKFAWDFKCFMAIKKLQDESEKEDCENFNKLFEAFEDHFIPKSSSSRMQLCPLM
ncbi:hypothetical protein PVAND_005324 [Polypedilum vanderplanki]|uniref:Uncharacterized protein n=1 Tax=Polypedilum vanderplanki TaxID=319348 RepID=A0A9J6C0H8_POLVA|nr:hypothetical protein PVAND_005324 [Polypedilum vanderplanki]